MSNLIFIPLVIILFMIATDNDNIDEKNKLDIWSIAIFISLCAAILGIGG